MPVLQVSTTRDPKPRSRIPSTKVMVDKALKSLNNRNGSSLAMVKKFIASTYNIDAEASSKRIKKYLKECLESGKFINTTGNGAGGSFKISPKFSKVPAQPKMKFKQPILRKKVVKLEKAKTEARRT